MNDLEHIKAWLGAGSINIFGRPFAGKDTQGALLAQEFNGTLLGGGDILRNSVLADELKASMKAGNLIPTDDYIRIVLPFLSKREHDEKPLILSSVGRWKGEEDGVMQATETSGHPMKAVIYLDLSEELVKQRWSKLHEQNDRGDRHDDTEEVLTHRLVEYRNKTLPVIEHYRNLGMLIVIDGSGTPEKVYADIITELAKRAKA